MRKAVLFAATAFTLALPGCDAITEAGCTAIAAGLSGVQGGTYASRSLTSGGGCRRIAGAVRRSLDERDRQRYDFATAQALQQRLPPQYYRPGYEAPTYQTASGYGGAIPTNSPPSRGRTSPRSSSSPTATDADTSSAAPSTPAGRFPGLAPVRGAQWVSDHSGASGSVQVISAEKPRDGRGECRTLVQTVRQSGEAAVTEQGRFCESQPGAADWTKI